MEKEIKYNILKHIGTISENSSGWTKELNLISWNGRQAKYDVRDWSPDHDKCGRGITLSVAEAQELLEALQGEL